MVEIYRWLSFNPFIMSSYASRPHSVNVDFLSVVSHPALKHTWIVLKVRHVVSKAMVRPRRPPVSPLCLVSLFSLSLLSLLSLSLPSLLFSRSRNKFQRMYVLIQARKSARRRDVWIRPVTLFDKNTGSDRSTKKPRLDEEKTEAETAESINLRKTLAQKKFSEIMRTHARDFKSLDKNDNAHLSNITDLCGALNVSVGVEEGTAFGDSQCALNTAGIYRLYVDFPGTH
jgi:hypothetical protein